MGQPVVHWALWSEQPQQLGDFYEKAFGWTVKALPEMYWLAETGGLGGINGGIMKPKEGPWRLRAIRGSRWTGQGDLGTAAQGLSYSTQPASLYETAATAALRIVPHTMSTTATIVGNPLARERLVRS